MKLKKIIQITVISTGISLILAAIANSDQSHEQRSKKALYEINQELEQLEFKLRNRDYKHACEHADKASRLIYKWEDSVKTIEPDYDWQEIRSVLLEIPLKHC